MNERPDTTSQNTAGAGNRRKITVKALLIEGAVALVLTGLIAWGLGLFAVAKSETDSVCAVLSDAFFIAGVLFAGVGGISWVASEGTFDVFSYGAKMLWEHLHVRQTTFEKYYDYKQRKAQGGKAWLADFVIVGVAMMLIAGIFLLLYSV